MLFRSAESEGRLAIFGAGRNAARLMEAYRFDAACYLDNNEERIGTLYLGKEIRPVRTAKEKGYLVLVAANDYAAIHTQLKKMELAEENILNGNRLL